MTTKIKLHQIDLTGFSTSAGSKRQAIVDAPVDTSGVASFIAPQGTGTTKHLAHFDEYSNSALTTTADEVAGASSTTLWQLVNGATLGTTWSKFGARSLALQTAAQYAQIRVAPFQYRTAVNGWTEEFFMYPTGVVTNRLIFRGDNNSGYGVVLRTNATGALTIYLSSTGGSWNIASAVILPVTIAANTEYHIAIVYNNTDYRVFVNGTLVFTRASGLKINTITRRLFGYSSSGFIGYIDEHRTSSAPLFLTSATVPTDAYTYTKSPRAVILPVEGDTLTASACSSGSDVPIPLVGPIVTQDLMVNNINYLYVDNDSSTGVVSIGSTPVPPQYGTTYDTTQLSYLSFDVHGTDIYTHPDTLRPAYVESSAEIDYYGSQWFGGPNNVIAAPVTPVMGAALLLDGSADSYLTSTIYALPQRWSFKWMFNAMNANEALTHTIFTYGANVNGYGIRVQWDQSNMQFRVWISTTGSSWNIANNATVPVGYNGMGVILSFDGTNYTLTAYPSTETVGGGVVTRTWASTAQVVGTAGAVLEIGRTYQTVLAKGYLSYFMMMPYVSSSMIRVANATTPLVKPTIRSDIHYFDVTEMLMKVTKTDGPSLAPETYPDFTTLVTRVFLGEVVLDATGVVSTRSYAVNGDYRSGWYPINANNNYTLAHNLGTNQYMVQNYINKFPRDAGRREEYGAVYWQNTDGAGRSAGASRIAMTAVDITMKTGTYLTSPVNVDTYDDYTTGYYYTVIKRNF